MDRGAMAMKGYFAFPKAPALLELHRQIVLYHIQDTCWGGLTALQRCRWYMLLPKSIRLRRLEVQAYNYCNILDFDKNHAFSSGHFLNFITIIKLVVSIFGIIYCSELFYSYQAAMSKVIGDTELSSLERPTGISDKKTKFKTWGMMFGKSVKNWITNLLLSAHPNSVADSSPKPS